MLLIIAGFPTAFIGILSPSALLVEVTSAGRAGAAWFRVGDPCDYPVMFGTLYVFTLLGLLIADTSSQVSAT